MQLYDPDWPPPGQDTADEVAGKAYCNSGVTPQPLPVLIWSHVNVAWIMVVVAIEPNLTSMLMIVHQSRNMVLQTCKQSLCCLLLTDSVSDGM